LARRQSGNLTRAQLLEVGLTEGGVDRRLRNGSLVTRYHGVYCQAPARQDPQALIAAAVLAGGPTAVASHGSAAWLWGFLPRWDPPPEITLTQGDRRPRHILTHRGPSLQPRDITRQHGIPTTTRARTLLDIAPRLTYKQLTRLVNNQRLDGHLRLNALHDIITRNPLHPAAKLLRPFTEDAANPTRSPLEDTFRAFIAKYDLPVPQINVRAGGRELDAIFPDHDLIVEVDGWGYHRDRQAFEDDRDRDADHLAQGLSTLRLTEMRLTTKADREATRLKEILALRRRRRG
jgi:hypothetical protein